jgi:hypothetical protein
MRTSYARGSVTTDDRSPSGRSGPAGNAHRLDSVPGGSPTATDPSPGPAEVPQGIDVGPAHVHPMNADDVFLAALLGLMLAAVVVGLAHIGWL